MLMETIKPLDLIHEYQVVFVEPSDGSHVFGVQLGGYMHSIICSFNSFIHSFVFVQMFTRSFHSSRCTRLRRRQNTPGAHGYADVDMLLHTFSLPASGLVVGA